MKKKFLCLVLMLSLMMAMSSITASAASPYHGGQGVQIPAGREINPESMTTPNGQTVYSRFYGSAGVNISGTYCCATLVGDYYEKAYGFRPYGLLYRATPKAPSGYFYTVSQPQPGDIFRDDSSYVHWGIVKSVEGNRVYVFQQNVSYISSDRAYIGAYVLAGDGNITYFRYSNASGTPQQVIQPSFTSQNASNIGETGAYLSASVNNPVRAQMNRCWLRLGVSSNSMREVASDSVNLSNGTINIWYELRDYGIALDPGTTYYYQICASIGGNTYSSDVKSFVTAGTTQPVIPETPVTPELVVPETPVDPEPTVPVMPVDPKPSVPDTPDIPKEPEQGQISQAYTIKNKYGFAWNIFYEGEQHRNTTVLTSADGSPEQQFYFEPVGDGSVRIYSMINGQKWQVYLGNDLKLLATTSSHPDTFFLIKQGNYWTIQNKQTGCFLTNNDKDAIFGRTAYLQYATTQTAGEELEYYISPEPRF